MKKNCLQKILFLLLIIFFIFLVKTEAKEEAPEIKLGEPLYHKIEATDENPYVEKYLTTSDNSIKAFNQISHTKEEIRERYEAATTTLTNKTTYETNAVITGPNYKAGTLTELAKSDTLKQLNFYRYLAGVADVTLYDKLMQYNYNGKGAVLLASSNFSHYPTQPEDMDDTFFKEATYGTSYPPFSDLDSGIYGIGGNIAYGTDLTLPKSIKGYIDDTSNVVANSVGHRLSLIDPSGIKTSFGSATDSSNSFYDMIYSTVTMYTGYYNSQNQIYTWPPAGYCPVEVTNVNELWSITLDDNLSYDKVTKNDEIYANVKIVLTCDDVDYEVKSNVFCTREKYGDYEYDSYNTIFFAIPNDLKTVINGGSTYLSGKKVTVKVTSGITRDTENVELCYNIEFFNAGFVEVEDIYVLKKDEESSVDKYVEIDYLEGLEGYVGKQKKLSFAYFPENATDTRYTLTFDNTEIATYDYNSNMLTFNKAGKTNCTVKSVSNTSAMRSFPINVYNNIQKIAFTETTYNLTVGDTLQTSIQFTPEDYLLEEDKKITYKVENQEIISVNDSGLLTALKPGTTTLTAIVGDKKSTATIVVENLVITNIITDVVENVENDVMEFDTNISFDSILTSDFFPVLDKSYSVKLYDTNNNLKDNTSNIGSKNIIKVFDTKNSLVAEYVVVVRGDISGNGKSELFDAFKILIGVLTDSDGTKLDELDKIIRDYNNDGVVALFDAFKFLIKAISN